MRPIVFLTDFGLDDEFVGICHAVIARIAPAARVIDLTHGIPPADVMRAATVLLGSLGYAPEDSVFLAVVDPGVGTGRRAVAVESRAGAILVGPDNGLLWPACDHLGGVARAVAISSPDVLLKPASATFHGRDVFAPAAAHLAAGAALEGLGPSIEPASLARLDIPAPVVAGSSLSATVLGIDRFGNVQLAAGPDDLGRAGLGVHPDLLVRCGDRAIRRVVHTFGDLPASGSGIVVDSAGRLAVVVNQGRADVALGARPGDVVDVGEALEE